MGVFISFQGRDYVETNLRGTERMSKRHITVAMNGKMVAIKLFKKGSYKAKIHYRKKEQEKINE